MKPVLKYPGGKTREIPNFSSYIPNSFSRYIEPFFGGGALFFHLEPASAILNDKNARLMTFYQQLRDNYDTMREQLDELQRTYETNQSAFKTLLAKNPDKRVTNENNELYYRMRELFNYPDSTKYLDSVVYYFINKTAFSGMTRYNSNGEFNVSFGYYANLNTELVTVEHSKLLQQADLHNVDYSDIFAMAEAVDFMFLDPPYDCVFNSYGNADMIDGFGEAEHRRLAADFRNSCRALMIIGKTPLTMELYGEFVTGEYMKNYSVNIKNRFNSDLPHMVVQNY